MGTVNPRIDSILTKVGIVVESGKEIIPKMRYENNPKINFFIAPNVENSDANCDIVCENDVCRIVKKSQVDSEASTSSEQRESRELTPEEKVERAKELLEAKRKQKEKEEEEVSQ